jgi:hypothetical protein
VGLHRAGDTLVLTPTGRLDPISVARLLDVALSRRGSFTHLVVDLRDLAEIESGGIDDLGRTPWDELDPVLWGDARTRLRLADFTAETGGRSVLYDVAAR